jgi:ABC-2 type transport system permease protein
MSWRQIFLVLKREYITRVRSKGFIWATILVPVGFAAVIGIMVFITVWESESTFEVAVKDETGQIASSLIDINERRYLDYSDLETDSLRALVQQDHITGYIIISEEHITDRRNPELIYRGSGGMEFLM